MQNQFEHLGQQNAYSKLSQQRSFDLCKINAYREDQGSRPYPGSQELSSQIEASVSTATPIGIESSRIRQQFLQRKIEEESAYSSSLGSNKKREALEELAKRSGRTASSSEIQLGGCDLPAFGGTKEQRNLFRDTYLNDDERAKVKEYLKALNDNNRYSDGPAPAQFTVGKEYYNIMQQIFRNHLQGFQKYIDRLHPGEKERIKDWLCNIDSTGGTGSQQQHEIVTLSDSSDSNYEAPSSLQHHGEGSSSQQEVAAPLYNTPLNEGDARISEANADRWRSYWQSGEVSDYRGAGDYGPTNQKKATQELDAIKKRWKG